MKTKSIIDFIGNTPLVEAQNIFKKEGVTLLLKLEGNNPGGSVKDRAAYNMISEALRRNNIKKGEILSKESFVYRSPQKGCSWSVGNQIFKEKQKIFTNINKDECLDIHHIQSKGLGKISNEDLNYCKKFNSSIWFATCIIR